MIRTYLGLCWEHPRRVLAIASVLTVLLAFFGFPQLDFTASRDTLFKVSAEELAKQEEFQSRFGAWNELILVFDGDRRSRREKAVLEYAELLQNSPLVSELRATLDLPQMDQIGLYFLTLEQLQEVDRALRDYREVLTRMSSDGWYGFLGEVAERGPQKAPPSAHQERIGKVWKQAVEREPLGELFPKVKVPQRNYYRDGSDRHMLFLQSSDPLAVQSLLDAHRTSFEGRVVLTGKPLLEALERQESIRDALLSTILAILVVQFLLVRGFRETARPRLGFLSLIFGLLWSVSWAGLSVGTLNIITINFLSITIGLGIDFSIHLLARYVEERQHMDDVEAMERTLCTTGLENLIGALATALAFGALTFTDFQAVRQLGLITGVAVPLCFLSVVSLYPPLLFWWEARDPAPKAVPATPSRLQSLETKLRARPVSSLKLATVVVLVMTAVGTTVEFDYNLLNLQSSRSEAVSYEKEGGFNSLAGFVVAEDSTEAKQLKTRLKALASVAEVQTVAELIPEQVEKKRPLVRSIAKKAMSLPLPSYQTEETPDWERLEALAAALSGDSPPDWVVYLGQAGPGPISDIWPLMQDHLKTELTDTLKRLRKANPDFQVGDWKRSHADLHRLSNADGKTVLRVRSSGVLWERETLEQFTAELESVTDQALGPPFLIRDYLEQLRASYVEAVAYALGAIVLLLLVHFRGSVISATIALVPKLVGAVGMFACMAVAGVDLNPANCMALPLTLGIGLVFGIHAVHRCLEAPDELLIGGPTGRAIALSGWTTIASFGTLMSASHPGIFSLGFVMAAGVGANMLATYLLVPPLIQLRSVSTSGLSQQSQDL